MKTSNALEIVSVEQLSTVAGGISYGAACARGAVGGAVAGGHFGRTIQLGATEHSALGFADLFLFRLDPP